MSAGKRAAAGAALILLALASPVRAVDCADYRGTPGLIGSFDDGFANVTTVEIVDDWVYYTRSGRSDLGVLDFTYPDAPRRMGILGLSIRPSSVSRDGDLAVAVGRRGTLQEGRCVVLDLLYPMAPRTAGEVPGLPILSGVDLVGTLAYATGTVGLHVVDCADRESPVEVGAVPTAHPLGWIAVEGTRAFAAAPGFGLYVFDISDSSAPAVTDSLAISGTTGGVELEGGRLYVTGTEGLRIYDVAGAPVLLGVAPEVSSTARVDVDPGAELAFVAGAPGGVRPVDVSDPAAPVALSPMPVTSGDVRLGFSGLVVASGRKVELWDVDAVFFGEPLGFRDQGVVVRGTAPFGDLLLLVEQYGGLQIVDWTDPGAMIDRGWQNLADNAGAVCVADSVAYVAAYQGGLEVVDISDPDAPFFLGRAWVPDRAYDVVCFGPYVFLADHRFGLEVLDVSDPAQPRFVQSRAGFTAVDLELRSDGVLFVADLTSSASPIFDVSNPENPVQIGMLPAYRPVAIATWAGFVYAAKQTTAGGTPRVEVLRADDPANVQSVGAIFPGVPTALLTDERFLYVGTGSGTVEIYSIATPAVPVAFGRMVVDGEVRSLAAGDHGIVVTTSTGRVYVYAPQCPVVRLPTGEGPAPPDHPRPLAVAPNPFRSTTEILVSAAAGGGRRVTVFDVAGRRVLRLDAPAGSAGRPLRLSWDGRDEAGAPVGSGVYFVRLESTGVRATERVILRR